MIFLLLFIMEFLWRFCSWQISERKYQNINFIKNVSIENNNETELQNSKWDQNFGNMAVYVVFIKQ